MTHSPFNITRHLAALKSKWKWKYQILLFSALCWLPNIVLIPTFSGTAVCYTSAHFSASYPWTDSWGWAVFLYCYSGLVYHLTGWPAFWIGTIFFEFWWWVLFLLTVSCCSFVLLFLKFGCGSGGRARTNQMIGQQDPWARYWTPYCSRCVNAWHFAWQSMP